MTIWYAPGIKGACPPYEWLYPCIALVARGKLLDWWIYKHYKGSFRNQRGVYPANPNRHNQWGSSGMVITKMWYSEQPRTGKQQGWRKVMYEGVYNWRQLDDPTKNYYNQRSKPIGDYGYHRYLSLYLKANYPMIIYWEPLKQSATENVTVPDYIKSSNFAIPLYPPAANKLVSLGPSGDLPLPGAVKPIGKIEAADHGTATNPEVINVTYGTGAPPAANTTTIGSIYITYTP